MKYAIALLIGLSACGTDDPPARAQAVWRALQQSEVARPIRLTALHDHRLDSPAVQCPAGGSATASAHHTEAWARGLQARPDGQVTGMVAYTLRQCRADRTAPALTGAVWRSFHAVERAALPRLNLPARDETLDVFLGRVTLPDGTPCELDARIAGRRAEGTVCNRPAAEWAPDGVEEQP